MLLLLALQRSIGRSALLQYNGSYNVALVRCFTANTTGADNTAVGTNALCQIQPHLTTQQLVKCFNATPQANNTAVALSVETLRVSNAGGMLAYRQTPLAPTTRPLDMVLCILNHRRNNTAWVIMLYSNTTARNNTAVGYQAGYSNTTGTNNTSLGIRLAMQHYWNENFWLVLSSTGIKYDMATSKQHWSGSFWRILNTTGATTLQWR
jgi:trimeric autotransporter adhesin